MARSPLLLRLLPLLLDLATAHPGGFVTNTTLAPNCTSHPSAAYFLTHTVGSAPDDPPYGHHQIAQNDA